MIDRLGTRRQDPSWGAESPRRHDYQSGYLVHKALVTLTWGLISKRYAVYLFIAGISLIDNRQILVISFYQDRTKIDALISLRFLIHRADYIIHYGMIQTPTLCLTHTSQR